MRREDTLAIWAPSFPGPVTFPNRFRRGVAALQAAGFRVRVGSSCLQHCGYAAAPPRQLAREFHEFLEDPEVAGIICAVGGWTVSAVLPHVDWQLLRDHPKVLVGYSDISALLLAALKMSQVITFHGPMVISEWGEMGGPWSFSREQFLRITMETSVGALQPPPQWTEELLWWERDDTRPRQPTGTGQWRFLREGTVIGPLVPACMPTFAQLVGTPYMPDLTGAILALETEAFTPDRFWAHLLQLEAAGILDQLGGFIVGRHCRPQSMPTGYSDFDEVLLRVVGDRPMPILADVDFGHTEPMLTLPVGLPVLLDHRTKQFSVLEAAVS